MASSFRLRLPTPPQMPLRLSRSTQFPLTRTTGKFSPHSSQLSEPRPVITDVNFPTHFPPQFCVNQSLCDKVSGEPYSTRSRLCQSRQGQHGGSWEATILSLSGSGFPFLTPQCLSPGDTSLISISQVARPAFLELKQTGMGTDRPVRL